MSQMEYHSGRLRKIPMKTDDSLEEQCKRVILKYSPDLDIKHVLKNYDSFKELMCDEYYGEYMVLNGRIYEILEHTQIDDDTFNVWEDLDGEINFAGSFYNGGTTLDEMLEDGLKSL